MPRPTAFLSTLTSLGFYTAAGQGATSLRGAACTGLWCKHSGGNFHEVLNGFYGNGTGLTVSVMHHGFKEDSLAPGVPLWACPANGTTNGTTCAWHQGKRYASSSWISYDLYGLGGIKLYQCNKMGCGSSAKLLLIYHPGTTVFGAAFVADANTDIDVDGMEGCSKSWMPPSCSEAAQACGALRGSDAKARASCLKQAGGNVGKPYTDAFSGIYGGDQEGTLLPHGSVRTPVNFTQFVETQRAGFDVFAKPSDYRRACNETIDPPCNSTICTAKTCTCNSGGYGYNEFPIRTWNPESVCAGHGRSCKDEYKQFVCDKQLPIAVAYIPGSSNEAFESNNKTFYYNHYMAQIERFCGKQKLPPLVQFNVTNAKTPFTALRT